VLLFSLVVSLQLAQLPAGLEASAPPVRRGAMLYVPLTGGGVAVVDVSDEAAPKVVGSVLEGRFVTRLVLDGDRLIALEAREEALVLSLDEPQRPRLTRALALPGPTPRAPAEALAPTPAPAAPQAPSVGTVTDVTQGRVIFDGGTSRGFRQGARVKVLSMRKVPKPDLVTGAMVAVPSGEVTAVLAIEQADEHKAMAVLGRGDTAEPGDRVEPTTEPVSERLLFPRRAPFEWRFGFVARPFLGLEGTTKPFGVMLDALVAWYPAGVPLSVTVMAAPFAFSVGGREAHAPGTFLAMAGYTTDFFEIALGAGALTGNVGPCVPTDGFGGTECEVNTGFTINQHFRLGSLDGFHLSWNSSIFSRPTKFVFGVGRGEVSVPLTSRLGLFAGGGGGENGWALGELGVRTAVGGAGGRGTVILRASLGYSAIFDGPSRETVGGPAVSFGMEWRL
jgi:hypothetical protein